MGPLTQDIDENLVLQASEKSKILVNNGKVALDPAMKDTERLKLQQFAGEA